MAEFKQFLRVDDADEDALLNLHLAAATSMLDGWQGLLGRSIVTQTLVLTTSGPSGNRIRLMFGVQSVTSVSVIDNNVAETWSATEYRLVTDDGGSYIEPKDDYDWPSYDVRDDAFTVTFVAGYGAPEYVPEGLKHIIKSVAANMYRTPEIDPINDGLRRQLNAYKGSFL